MKSNKAAHQVRRLISGGILLLSVITLYSCKPGNDNTAASTEHATDTTEDSGVGEKLKKIPHDEVISIMENSDQIEALDTDLIGKSLTAHTVASFENYMKQIGLDTVQLTQDINQISQANNEGTLAEKGLIWHIGLYPMLSTESGNRKKRIKSYVMLTLVHYDNNNNIDNVYSYRDSNVRKTIYKDLEVPVYDLGHNYP